MENSIYLGLSRQVALRTNMDIIANNVANMNTTGFRGQNTLFHEFLSEPRGHDDPLSFVNDEGHYQITSPGSVRQTDSQLDIAIVGPGFISVQSPAGEVQYTRDGNFSRAADGTLITQAGFPVVTTGGGTITIPDDTMEIAIDDRGNISNQDGQLGQIGIFEFENVQQLEQQGNNLYQIVGGNAEPAQESRVRQGYLEGSNVQPVIEMTRMIDTLRDYQSVQRVIQSENDRLRSAIQKLTGSN
ncbi:MAG: flagellar basal-body rod protein FlgF [Bdellovibrionales bacterium]